MKVLELLLVMSNLAVFLKNFTFNIIMLSVRLSSSLTIAKLGILSVNGASILTNVFSPGFIIIFSFGNIGMDQFRKLKQHSYKLITPSNSNTFLIPKTISTFS